MKFANKNKQLNLSDVPTVYDRFFQLFTLWNSSSKLANFIVSLGGGIGLHREKKEIKRRTEFRLLFLRPKLFSRSSILLGKQGLVRGKKLFCLSFFLGRERKGSVSLQTRDGARASFKLRFCSLHSWKKKNRLHFFGKQKQAPFFPAEFPSPAPVFPPPEEKKSRENKRKQQGEGGKLLVGGGSAPENGNWHLTAEEEKEEGKRRRNNWKRGRKKTFSLLRFQNPYGKEGVVVL